MLALLLPAVWLGSWQKWEENVGASEYGGVYTGKRLH